MIYISSPSQIKSSGIKQEKTQLQRRARFGISPNSLLALKIRNIIDIVLNFFNLKFSILINNI